MKQSDKIFIRGQKVSCHIGVPEEERLKAQELLIHTTLMPPVSMGGMGDDITKTIDYHQVYVRVGEVASERSRKLLETLAEDLASMILSEFPVESVAIEIEKFILPNAQSTGVAITRVRQS